jgi:hypothetical protein
LREPAALHAARLWPIIRQPTALLALIAASHRRPVTVYIFRTWGRVALQNDPARFFRPPGGSSPVEACPRGSLKGAPRPERAFYQRATNRGIRPPGTPKPARWDPRARSRRAVAATPSRESRSKEQNSSKSNFPARVCFFASLLILRRCALVCGVQPRAPSQKSRPPDPILAAMGPTRPEAA